MALSSVFSLGGAFLLSTLLSSPPNIDWHTDLASAEAAARESGKAMLIAFR